ncbi:leucine-rich repeat domain-containing protein [Arenibacterium sp. CAU 1754]
MIPHYPPDPIWNEEPEAALAEVERRIRDTGRTYLGSGNFQALDRLPANIGETTDDQIILSGTRIHDISALSSLRGIRQLTLSKYVTDISAVAGMGELEHLDFYFSKVTDLSPLAMCRKLSTIVNLPDGPADLSPLGKVEALRHLQVGLSKDRTLPEIPGLIKFLAHAQKGEDFDLDLGFLAASPNLEMITGYHLRGFNPPIKLRALTRFSMGLADPNDFGIVAKYPSLIDLSVRSTDIRDLSAIPRKTRLQELDLSGTRIGDIRRLTKLKHLTKVDVSGTMVDDIVPLSFCSNLERIAAAGTKIASLSGWNPDAHLRSLNVSDTGFSDLQPLVGTYLNHLSARNTPLSDLSGMSGIRGLSGLDISGTKVADIPQAEMRAAVLKIRADLYDYRDRMWFEFRDTPLAASGFKPQSSQLKSSTDTRQKRSISLWKRLLGR